MATKRVLILGGTEFVGRAFVDEALARGHDVTVLNRGTHEPRPDVTTLVGDRSLPGELDAAVSAPGEWDVVVDTWSWAPRAVADAAAALRDRAGRYVYVSSRSVYSAPGPLADESAAVVESSADDDGFADYARAKAGGELGAVAGFGDRATLLRAGLIIGPHENIGRLPWWLSRIARGGPVVAPGPPDLGVQYIDARDLAGFGLDADISGPVDIVTPPGAHTMGDVLEACVRVTASDARLTWIDPETVLRAGVEPWIELPIWIPAGEDHDGMHAAAARRAADAGLTTRPLLDTVVDTWEWLRSIGGTAPQRPDRPVVGLPLEKEQMLLRGVR
jgi:2'-hydroxyisoflavone reductase